ncbi:MAG: hypothetical protein ABIA93_04280 [Candidatus Woesearchaeota archaeon]
MPMIQGMGHGLYGYGWLFQIVILILFFLVLWWLLKGKGMQNETPEQILKRRLALGEITEKEYKRLKKELE